MALSEEKKRFTKETIKVIVQKEVQSYYGDK